MQLIKDPVNLCIPDYKKLNMCDVVVIVIHLKSYMYVQEPDLKTWLLYK